MPSPYRAFVSFFNALGKAVQPEKLSDTPFTKKEEKAFSSSENYFCKTAKYNVVNVYQEPITGNQIALYEAGSNIGCQNSTLFYENLAKVDANFSNGACGLVPIGYSPIKPDDTFPFAGSTNAYHITYNGVTYTSISYVCGSGVVLSSVNISQLNQVLVDCAKTTLNTGMSEFNQAASGPACPTDFVLLLKIAAGVIGGLALLSLCFLIPKVQVEHKTEPNHDDTLDSSPPKPAPLKKTTCCARLFSSSQKEELTTFLLEDDELIDSEKGGERSVELTTKPRPATPRPGSPRSF